jgi:hypothetical protein
MKKIFIPFLAVSLLSFSCQKSNNLVQKANASPETEPSQASRNPSYFLSFRINGVTKNFNYYPVAIKTTTSWNFTILEIKGSTSAPSGETFSIAIDNTKSAKSISSGFYEDNSPSYSLEAEYVPGTSGIFHTSLSGINQSQNGAVPANGDNFHTIISSFANGEIKGTFSGDFYKNNDPNSSKISITDGAFYVHLN